MIKAPFNFIPLSDRVVFPDWASKISHDVPFSDGISGSIKISLTAQTPIFVRNGHSRDDKDTNSEEYSTFSKIGEKYFLPGTTVKGAIRNTLEILSFGKMRLDKNARFAQREWDNTALYPMKEQQGNVKCGWLKIKEDGSCEIVDCGRPLRIGHDQIDSYFDCRVFEDEFSKQPGRNLNDERQIGDEMIDPKTAYYKYRLIERMGSLEDLEDLTFSQDENRITRYNSSRMKVDPEGEVKGSIVLTGQPDLWENPRPRVMTPTAGKFYEFVFKTPGKNAKRYVLTEEEFNQYKFIYADSPDWKYANDSLLHHKGIPVFFRMDANNTKIKDWGLAFLYKLPYERTPYETLPADHRKDNHDMAECIFGYTDKESSLKGRVQFSPFMSENASLDSRSYRLVLNGPKASYYPIYIDQEGVGNQGNMNYAYRTYNDGMIRGWKRYLHRDATWERHSGSDTVDTYIRPINAGAIFGGTIRFHNLRPEELGALLSAITFHGNEGSCSHQIGMAKPYGYGKVKVDIKGISLHSVGAIDDDELADAKGYMAIFEKYMTDKIGMRFTMSPTVKELLIMSKYNVPDRDQFKYMVLDMEGHNEFSDAKGGRNQAGRRFYLQRFSEIMGNPAVPDSLPNDAASAVSRLEQQRNSHNDELKRIQEEREQAEAQRILEERRREEERKAEEERMEEERRRQQQAEAQAAKVAAGLSMLEEKRVDNDDYKVKEFKNARNKIDSFLKTLGKDQIPEEEFPALRLTLLRLSATPSKEEKKKKSWSTRDSNIWKYVDQKASPDFSDSLFAEINH